MTAAGSLWPANSQVSAALSALQCLFRRGRDRGWTCREDRSLVNLGWEIVITWSSL